MESPETVVFPIDRVMIAITYAVVGLVAIFLVLTAVRLWSLRMQTKSASLRGLDTDRLRHQLLAGEITQEEYDAVCGSLAGAEPSAAPARSEGVAETPIEKAESRNDDPERSSADGQE